MSSGALNVYLIAGEPSGDVLGARLMAALRREQADISFTGVGGPLMAEEGLHSLFPMTDLTVMGLSEVLPRLPLILRRIRETAADIRAKRPDVVVTIDSPDFCLRVAKRLKGSGIPVVHYVAPSVWAWRPGRAKKIARVVDHLLCLLPFEPPYFEKEGLAATFVGHSILESRAGAGDGAGFRARHGIPADAPLLAVLPGSRMGEVGRLLPLFGETLRRLSADVPGLRAVVPTVPGVAAAVREAVKSWPNALVVEGEGEKYDAFAAADAALAASGTVTLELAMAGVPTAVAYRVQPLSAAVARRMLKIPYVTLINLIAEKPIYPEFLQENCTADNLTAALRPMLTDKALRQEMQGDIDAALAALRPGEAMPSAVAAGAVLEVAGARARSSPPK